MLIKVDYRESELSTKLRAFLSSKNYSNISITLENLQLGDIIICDDKGVENIIIERKTLQDLASSIRDGRYKEQSFRLNDCNIHNHNIVYLVEGNIQGYKPYSNKGGNTAVDKYALMSSMVSITYFKGFSLYKSNSVDESAEWIIQTAYKLGKEGGKSFYSLEQKEDSTNYSSVVKRTKKNNITPVNIGEIMLGQIPNVSSVVAIAVMERFKTIKELIHALSKDKTALNGVATVNKNGQSRKISKTSIENIYNYLVASLPEEINVST